MDPLLHRSFGNCRVTELLDDPLTRTYRAVQEPSGRVVAVKALRETIVPTSLPAGELSREAQLLARFHHPKVRAIFDFVKTDETMWMVLEDVQGVTLAEMLAATGAFSASAAVTIAEDLATALTHIHAEGVVHNIDNLHQNAGSQGVLELHGNIFRTKSFRENVIVTDWAETSDVPPLCPHCGGPLRPDVVWFGESLPQKILEKAIAAATSCDLLFSIGTSSLVHPAASNPLLAREQGAVTIEINPQPTPLTPHLDYHLAGPAGEILPELVAAAWPSPPIFP